MNFTHYNFICKTKQIQATTIYFNLKIKIIYRKHVFSPKIKK